MRLILPFLASGLLAAAAAAQGPARRAALPPGPDTVRVGPQGVRVVVPVPRRATWAWNRPETGENRWEYRWELVVGEYGAGFVLFRRPGAVPDSGSLAALVAAGQWSVSAREPGRGAATVVPELRVEVEALGDSALALAVTDSATLARLFAVRPTTARLEVHTPYGRRAPRTLPVVYAAP